jgi:hypothetical protein
MFHPIFETANVEHMVAWRLHYSFLELLLANVTFFRVNGLTWFLSQRKQTDRAVLTEQFHV